MRWLVLAGVAAFAVLALASGARGPRPPAPAKEHPRSGTARPGSAGPNLRQEQRSPPRYTSPRDLASSWGRWSADWQVENVDLRLESMVASATPRLASRLRRAAEAAVLEAGAGSRGAVRAVAVRGNGARRDVLVATREKTLAPRAATHYRLYVGVAVHDRLHGWRMARWGRAP